MPIRCVTVTFPFSDSNTSVTDDRSTRSSRRRFLAGAATGATIAAAGCLGGIGGGGGGGPISIGLALPYSGPLSLLGQNITEGLELRLSELDNQLDGRDVEVSDRDTQSRPEQGVSRTRELLQQEDVDFVVGPVSSAVAAAMMPVIQEAGTATWINPNAGNDALVRENCSRYHFRVGWSNWHGSAPMGPWAYENVADNVYLTYSDYAAGQQYKSNFAETFTEAGGEIVGETGAPLGTTDFAPYLQDVRQSGADAIWSFIPGADGIKYIKQVHSFEIDQEMEQMGAGFLFTQLSLPALGEAAIGKQSILHYTWNKDIERNNVFKQAFAEEYDKRANVFAVSGYDSAQAIEMAVSETGGTEPDPIVDVLEGATIDSPRGEFTIDAERHDPHMTCDIREVVAGDGDAPPENRVVESLGKRRVPWTCDF